MSASYGLVAGRMRAAIVDLERECQVLKREVQRLNTVTDAELRSALIKGLALDLQSLYTGAEHIFELVARQVDFVEPSGESWRRELLSQMAAENSGVRPAVVSRELHSMLGELLGFRHCIRSVYSFDIDEAKVLERAREAPRLCDRLIAELGAAAESLERATQGPV